MISSTSLLGILKETKGSSLGRYLAKCKVPQTRPTVRPQQLSQVRNLPWVPIAYRKGATAGPAKLVRAKARASARGRTPPARRSRKSTGHRGADTATDTQNGTTHGSLSFAIQSHKESLLGIQKELDLCILRYRRGLGAEPSSTTDLTEGAPQTETADVPSHQVTSLLAKLSGLHTSCRPDSWKHAEETEDGFREVGRLVSDMIGLSARIQSLVLKELAQKGDKHEEHELYFYCSMAEQLLLVLIEMQADRLTFVDAAMALEGTSGESKSATVGWFRWLKTKLLDQTDEKTHDNAADIKSKSPMAHEDPLCVPRLEHFQSVATVVLNTLRQELKNSRQSPFRKIRRAQRLQQLLEKSPPNVEADATTVRSLLNAYSLMGSYESARSCENIANTHIELRNELFGSVLHAYFMAAKSSPRNQERSKAALRAEELARLQWDHDAGYDEKKFVHCTKAILCLNAVGVEAIPDICKRADILVHMCVGRENLEEVFRNGNLESLWKIAPSTLTLPLLNCLVLVYATSRDPSRVNLAKRLLQILLEDSDFKENANSLYPDVRTCKAVLAGLVGINDRRIRWSRVSSPDDKTKMINKNSKDSSPENLNYGMEMLDQMFARSQCWPDQPYFHSLFRLLLMARPKESGSAADMILSKMHIRECFSGHLGNWTLVTRKTYHYVLRAWLASAKEGAPKAAKRALNLVESMESQSLPLLSQRGQTTSQGAAIHRYSVAPDRSTYQLLLKICGSVALPGDKEEALNIALIIDKKMKLRGISLTSDSYSLLFSCCSNLLPENSKRRQSVTQQLLEDAREQGNINMALLGKSREKGPEKPEQPGIDPGTTGDKPSDGSGNGGLLSDLI